MADLIPVGSTLRAGKDAINAKIASLEAVDASQQKQITTEQQERIAADSAHANATVAHTAEQIRFVEGQSVKQKVDAQQSQINNIIGGPASSAAEVIDGRLGADGTARATIGTMIREIHSKQLAQNDQSTTVKRGINIINTSQASPAEVKVQGRTLVNLLGKDGGCESLAPFINVLGTNTLSAAQFKNGSNSIKVVCDGASNYVYKDYSVPLDVTKQYILSGWVYIESNQSGYPTIRLYDLGSTLTPRSVATANISIIGSWQHIYVKIPIANKIEGNGFRLVIGGVSSPTFTAYFDSVRLYELSEADNIAIGTTYLTDDAIDSFIPYVDGVQHLQGASVRKIGKNMLPPFTEWTVHANAKVVEPYKLQLEATASWQATDIDIPVSPNTTYTLSVTRIGSGQIGMATLSANKTQLSSLGFSPVDSFTKTTEPNAAYIRVRFSNATTTGLFSFINPLLELGSVVSQFMERNDDYANFPLLSSNVDRTIADSFDTATGRTLRRWKTGVVLDGSLTWLFHSDNTGNKVVKATLPTALASYRSALTQKFNGSIISQNIGASSTFAPDNHVLDNANLFYIGIGDVESGWSETLNPNSNAIKALMNGWKASANSGGVYSSWVSILTGIAPITNTEAYCAANKAPGWVGWATVDYLLARSIEELFTGDIGSVALQAGGNHLEYIEGVVVREKANPYLSPAKYYNIGNPAYPSSMFKYKASRIINVYKNDVIDTKWATEPVSSIGDQKAYISEADFDTTAVYTVTFQVLDKYQYTSNVIDATTRFKSNPKMVQDQLVQDIADLETQGAVNVRAIAELYKKVKALGG